MLITAQMIRNEIMKRKAQIMDRAYQRRNIGAKRSARYVDRLADKPIDHTGTQAKFKRLQKGSRGLMRLGRLARSGHPKNLSRNHKVYQRMERLGYPENYRRFKRDSNRMPGMGQGYEAEADIRELKRRQNTFLRRTKANRKAAMSFLRSGVGKMAKAEGMKEFFGSSFTEGARPKKKDHKAKVRPATSQESSFVEGAKPSAKNTANGKKYYEGPFKSKFWNKWYRQNKYAAGRGLRFMGRNAVPLAIVGGLGAGAYYAHKKNRSVGKVAKRRSINPFC